MQCHSLLAEISADAPKQENMSCLMHGCQTVRPCCRFVCKKKKLYDGRQYQSRSVQEAVNRRNIDEQVGKHLRLAVSQKENDRIKELKEKKENVWKELSMSQ